VKNDPQFLYLTTTGRRTGLAREIEIWFTRHEDRYYVIAELGERAQWVRNLVRDRRVTVRVGDERFSAHARIVPATTEAALVDTVRRSSEAKYGWGDGLVVALERVRE
jgi:deazaflavin-dependent oxidoreductase (nitroreductase family)